jgi:UDP-glucose 6-dehydrogenase
MHKLSFLGLGPVGLCITVCFAAKGYKVIASEIDKTKANQIKKGKPPFYEQDFKEMLQETINSGNL